MALPKFISFVQALENKQLSQFKKYTLSCIGAETEAYGVLEYLSADYSWRKQYPGNDELAKLCLAGGSQKTFLNYLSMLYDIAQDWMALDQLRKQPYEQDILVQRWLNRQGLHQQAEQVRAKVLRKLDDEVGVDYNLDRYRSEVNFEYLFCNNPDMNEYREEDYLDMIQGFDAYYTAKMTLMMCEVHSFERVFHKDMSPQLQHMQSKTHLLHTSRMAELARLAYKMKIEEDFHALQQLMDAILNGELLEGSLMHRVIVRYTVLSAIQLWSLGKEIDTKKIGAMVQYGLSTGVYSDDGMLAPTVFHNMVSTLSQVYSEKEMLVFVKRWSKSVDERYQEAAAEIGKAQVYFYFGKYHLIFDHTNAGNMSANQRYLAQGLDLIAGFENRLKKPEQYQRYVKNFTNYIKYNRDKLSANTLTKYRNLYRLLRDIDQKKGRLSIGDYQPIYYRKYALQCLEKKNGGL